MLATAYTVQTGGLYISQITTKLAEPGGILMEAVYMRFLELSASSP